jgi:hypothetical protein
VEVGDGLLARLWCWVWQREAPRADAKFRHRLRLRLLFQNVNGHGPSGTACGWRAQRCIRVDWVLTAILRDAKDILRVVFRFERQTTARINQLEYWCLYTIAHRLILEWQRF